MIDTGVLRGFAVRARVDLIGEVGARLDVVLAAGSSERVERPGVVVALERVVELEGRDAVVDRVAYTWFNRLIAFRFMDVNGFTRAGVVSPEAGKLTGQPQVLADAKGGDFDGDVVGVKTQAAVTALLNGTRLSVDAQGEAYGLLVEAYCRFWNRVMPFMFEREGDFTELLLPTDLLAANSVRSRAVQVLTEDVCKDVEVIGWLYQFYISERKDEVFAGFKKGKKAGAAEIPAATQLFTPDWIVRYLVENSLGRLWMLNHPDSHLVDQMDYYIAPVDEESDFLKISSPEEIRIIDPACGSGHMLTYAFDLLYAIYLEESYAPSEIPGLILKHNLFGTEIDPRAGSLAAFALTMKARAKQSTFFNRPTEPNICVLRPISFTPAELDQLVTPGGDRFAEEDFWNAFAQADTLGALIQVDEALIPSMRTQITTLGQDETLFSNDLKHRAETVITQSEYLASRYHVVVANPPYMGSKNMDPELSTYLRLHYEGFHPDLFAAFICRIRQLVVPSGRFGIMSPNVWLYILTHMKSRVMLTGGGAQLRSLVELPLSGFKGATVQICAFTAAATDELVRVHFVRLVDVGGREDALTEALRADVQQSESGGRVHVMVPDVFINVPNRAIAYWLSERLLAAFSLGRPLMDVAMPRQGMATADNDRFLRLWHEVSECRTGLGMTHELAVASNRKWFPYNKGGEFRKWYGNQEWLVNWAHDGEELRAERPKAVIRSPQHYFAPALSWSKIGTGRPAFRYFPRGFLFDVAGTSIFADEASLQRLSAILNSSVARRMLAATSPTLNLEVGTLAQFPVAELPSDSTSIVSKLITLHAADWDRRETSWSFRSLPFLAAPQATRLQARISDDLAAGLVLVERVRELETMLNGIVARAYRVEDEVEIEAPTDQVTLFCNPFTLFGKRALPSAFEADWATACVEELVSYAVGCMFGRYSLDEPGLILADQGATAEDYFVKVPAPSFVLDADNVIPIVDGDWFEDDVVGKFRQFLRVAFGEEHFEENLKFVVDSLGVKNLREYFVKSFYKDHVQRYKKRPIYWLFSSSKGSFNALIYLHRYNPSTVSTVLNDYLREYIKKLEVSLEQQERIVAAGSGAREVSVAQKESDRLRKVLIELADYERDLYALASQQIALDLDDGVLVNYQKFGKALKDIGLKKGAAGE